MRIATGQKSARQLGAQAPLGRVSRRPDRSSSRWKTGEYGVSVEVTGHDPASRLPTNLVRDGFENEVAASHEIAAAVASACGAPRV